MAGKSIYPSIPAAGTELSTMVPALNAMRQTLVMIIMNAQNPDPNYSASSASQVFVTNADLQRLGVATRKNQIGLAANSPAANAALGSVDVQPLPVVQPEIKVVRDDRKS